MRTQYKPVKKLGGDYVRPEKTLTDKLTPEQIEEKLENYSQTYIENIPLNVHVRYFKMEDGKRKFCLGGLLYQNTGLPVYVKLSNGTNVWSVQTKDTIFFRKMTPTEIKTEHHKDISELEEKVNKLTAMNEILEAENKKLKAYIKKMKGKIEIS